MKALSQTEASFPQVLLNWGAVLLPRAVAAMKLKPRANDIAALVAASNNPAGA